LVAQRDALLLAVRLHDPQLARHQVQLRRLVQQRRVRRRHRRREQVLVHYLVQVLVVVVVLHRRLLVYLELTLTQVLLTFVNYVHLERRVQLRFYALLMVLLLLHRFRVLEVYRRRQLRPCREFVLLSRVYMNFWRFHQVLDKKGPLGSYLKYYFPIAASSYTSIVS
jgi:hypothetical protein